MSIDTTYADVADRPDIKAHQQAHDTLHAWANKFDTATPSNGQVLVWDAAAQLWKPGNQTGGSGGAAINDTTAADNTTYSSNKINTQIAAATSNPPIPAYFVPQVVWPTSTPPTAAQCAAAGYPNNTVIIVPPA